MNKNRWRFIVRLVFVGAVIAAGIVRVYNGDVSSGVTFMVAGLAAATVSQILIWRRDRRTKATGVVPFDERDIHIAGAAALFTVRTVMLVLSIVMVVAFAAGADWEAPIIVPVGITLFITSAVLRVSYRVLRRK